MTATVLAYLPSPAQGVWHLGPVPVRAYALCILVGIVAALIIGDRRWVARGGVPGVIYDVALWAVPFGLIGGRLYHVITDWTTYFGDDGKGFGAALRIWDGGLGIWGAVALGGIGAWIACRRRGIPLPAFGDAIAPGIVLAQAIGRLGNYFNQELYGQATTVPWGLEVYERRNAAGALDSLNGVSTGRLIEVVHPTFLYELIWNLLVFAVLIWVDRRFKIGHGRLFALYVAGYCVGRFWIELMRSDYATTIADTGIRVNTFTSTFVFIGAVVYIMLAPKGREDPATLKGNDYDESLLDEVGEEITAIAATSGVVAAATVAGADDKSDESEELDEHESEAAAEADDLTDEVATAPSEDIEEAEAFAAAGADSDRLDAESLEPDVAEGESGATDDAAPEDGLGSVDGDEVAEATDDAAEVHEAAVEGEKEAEGLAEELAAEADEEDEAEDDAEPAAITEPEAAVALEGTEVAEALEAEPEADVEPEVDVEPEADAEVEADADAEPEEGLGSVDGDEVAEATDDAVEVHEAAVEGEVEAESLAEDVAAEDTEASDTEAPDTEVPDTRVPDTADTAAEDTAAEDTPAEAIAAEDAADVAEPESDEAEAEEAAAPEAGLGSVDGDEVAEATDDAVEVHEAAVEGEVEAESLAEDVAAEDTEAPDIEVPDTAADDTPAEATAAEATAAEDAADVAGPESDEVEAEEAAAPEAGLGSVDGDEVAEATDDAAEVHEAAVEGEQEAESLAEDTAAAEAETETLAEPVTDEPRRPWWRRRKG